MRLHYLIGAVLACAASAVLPAADQSAGSASGTAAGQLDQADHDFVTKAAIGGLFEVESAKLAQSKQIAPEHQKLVQMILTDHTAANAELTGYAQARGLSLPTALDEAHRAKLEALRKLDGRDFEKAFQQAQIEAHTMAIAVFTTASTDSKDADLRAWAGKTLPTLVMHQKHLQEASAGQGAAHGMQGSDKTHNGHSY